jgi:hypothetical protein
LPRTTRPAARPIASISPVSPGPSAVASDVTLTPCAASSSASSSSLALACSDSAAGSSTSSGSVVMEPPRCRSLAECDVGASAGHAARRDRPFRAMRCVRLVPNTLSGRVAQNILLVFAAEPRLGFPRRSPSQHAGDLLHRHPPAEEPVGTPPGGLGLEVAPLRRTAWRANPSDLSWHARCCSLTTC